MKNTKIIFVVFIFLYLVTDSVALQNASDIYENKEENVSLGKKVNSQDINKLVRIITPEELGIGDVRADNIDVRILGTKVVFQDTTTADLIKSNVNNLKSQEGYEILISSLKGITTKTMQGLTLTSSLEVFEVTPIYANAKSRVYRTKKNIQFKVARDYTNINVIEILSGEIASNVSELLILGNKSSVIEQSPLTLHWNFKNMRENESVNITYFVKNLLVGDEKNILIAVGDPEGVGIIVGNNNQANNFFVRELGFRNDPLEKILGMLTFAKVLWIFSILAIAVFIGSILIMELEGRNVFEGAKNICRDIESAARLGLDNKRIIDQYIYDCLNKGHGLEDIRGSLLRAGWDRKAVRKLLDKYKEN